LTALAGVVGPLSQAEAREQCAAALAGQALYGRSIPSIRSVDGAAFGICVFATLPEDSDDQPIADERLLLVADARLDNRKELCEALGLDPVGMSDRQLLLAAWLRWGVATLERIVGDFGLAAFDFKRRELVLARDPTGQKPLFFSVQRDRIAFASMPSGLFCAIPPVPDLNRIAQVLGGFGSHDDRSPFVGIRRVLPGHVVHFTEGRERSSCYWRPRLDPFEQTARDELVEQYRSLLDSAVKAQIRRAAVPLATHLSSGFDSTAVTTTATRFVEPKEIVAFTAAPAFEASAPGPYGRPIDESAVAAETARQFGIEHVVVRSSAPLLEVVRGYARYYQEPVRNVLNAGWWSEINRQAAASGAVVLLTAEMGNMSLNAGELGMLSEFVRHGRWAEWWRQAIAAWRYKDASWRGVAMASFDSWLPAGLVRALERGFGARPSWSIRYFREELLPASDQRRPRLKGQAAARLSTLTGIDFGPLRKGCLGETGVDQRDPMADRRLAEFGLRLPPEQLIDNGVFAPLARQALSDRVPDQVLNLPKRGFQGGDWPVRLRQQDAAEILEEIAPSRAAQQLLNLAQLRQAIANWPKLGPESNANLVFGRDFTAALAAGVFVADVERDPNSLGR
jgi:asparagine synthase (glutamine-hydrolysing)